MDSIQNDGDMDNNNINHEQIKETKKSMESQVIDAITKLLVLEKQIKTKLRKHIIAKGKTSPKEVESEVCRKFQDMVAECEAEMDIEDVGDNSSSGSVSVSSSESSLTSRSSLGLESAQPSLNKFDYIPSKFSEYGLVLPLPSCDNGEFSLSAVSIKANFDSSTDISTISDVSSDSDKLYSPSNLNVFSMNCWKKNSKTCVQSKLTIPSYLYQHNWKYPHTGIHKKRIVRPWINQPEIADSTHEPEIIQKQEVKIPDTNTLVTKVSTPCEPTVFMSTSTTINANNVDPNTIEAGIEIETNEIFEDSVIQPLNDIIDNCEDNISGDNNNNETKEIEVSNELMSKESAQLFQVVEVEVRNVEISNSATVEEILLQSKQLRSRTLSSIQKLKQVLLHENPSSSSIDKINEDLNHNNQKLIGSNNSQKDEEKASTKDIEREFTNETLVQEQLELSFEKAQQNLKNENELTTRENSPYSANPDLGKSGKVFRCQQQSKSKTDLEVKCCLNISPAEFDHEERILMSQVEKLLNANEFDSLDKCANENNNNSIIAKADAAISTTDLNPIRKSNHTTLRPRNMSKEKVPPQVSEVFRKYEYNHSSSTHAAGAKVNSQNLWISPLTEAKGLKTIFNKNKKSQPTKNNPRSNAKKILANHTNRETNYGKIFSNKLSKQMKNLQVCGHPIQYDFTVGPPQKTKEVKKNNIWVGNWFRKSRTTDDKSQQSHQAHVKQNGKPIDHSNCSNGQIAESQLKSRTTQQKKQLWEPKNPVDKINYKSYYQEKGREPSRKRSLSVDKRPVTSSWKLTKEEELEILE